ncbi:MAG: carotenoid biosynthesis protein [Flavobacterium sp.]
MWKKWLDNPSFCLGFIVILHVTGWIGFALFGSDFFLLTPLNLLLSTFIILYHQKSWTNSLKLKLFIVALLGFLVEVAGVNTGTIFGVYAYDQALGFKIWGTPPMIGVNWMLLTYVGTISLKKWFTNSWLVAISTALILVALDLVIEPVAIANGFWHWDQPDIPLQNFIAWGACAFFFSILLQTPKEPLENPLALWFLLIQLVFFGVMNGFV